MTSLVNTTQVLGQIQHCVLPVRVSLGVGRHPLTLPIIAPRRVDDIVLLPVRVSLWVGRTWAVAHMPLSPWKILHAARYSTVSVRTSPLTAPLYEPLTLPLVHHTCTHVHARL
jgi:hypothetical protein